MISVEPGSHRYFAYGPDQRRLYIYRFVDFEQELVLASFQQVSKKELDQAVNEAYDEERKWMRSKDENGPAPSLSEFMFRKFGMSQLANEVETSMRPDDWVKKSNDDLDEEIRREDEMIDETRTE